MSYRFQLSEGETVSRPGVRTRTYGSFRAWATGLSHREVAHRLEPPFFCPALFTHHRRRDIEITAAQSITLDIDNKHVADHENYLQLQEVEAALEAQGLEHLIYSTYHHSPVLPQFRVVIPISSLVSTKEWRHLVRHLLRALNLADRVGPAQPLDPSTLDRPGQALFVPSHKAGAGHFLFYKPGEPIDPAIALSDADLDAEPDFPLDRAANGSQSRNLGLAPQGRHLALIRTILDMYLNGDPNEEIAERVVERDLELHESLPNGPHLTDYQQYPAYAPRRGETPQEAMYRCALRLVTHERRRMDSKYGLACVPTPLPPGQKDLPDRLECGAVVKEVIPVSSKTGSHGYRVQFRLRHPEHLGDCLPHVFWTEGSSSQALAVSGYLLRVLARAADRPEALVDPMKLLNAEVWVRLDASGDKLRLAGARRWDRVQSVARRAPF